MIARLDEFSKKQLQLYLGTIVLAIENKKADLKEYWCCDHFDAIEEEIDDLQLFRVQLLNAIGKVGLQEEIASN